jgi:DNA recombination protein RmuC
MDNIILLSILGVLVIFVLLSGAVLYVVMSSRKQGGESDVITQLNKLISDRLNENKDATMSVHGQVESFTRGMSDLRNRVEQVQESVKSVVSFQDIFKSPKLRGNWGEASLESSLGQYFGRDQYEIQHYFISGEAVDAVLKLPNNLMLPIDSKFNWENFEKMVKADNDINRDIHRKQFLSDVKKKIDEIASKYILPSENTTDMALMYVPAESIYYELVSNIEDVDVPKYARLKKVVLVSPNTFYLTVSAIHQWFRNVEVSGQTKEIMKRLERLRIDGEKLDEEFRVLGKHISNASGAYGSTEKRLGLMVLRVKNIVEIGEDELERISEEDIPKISQ